MLAAAYLAGQYGAKSASIAYRWVRASEAVWPELRTVLKTMTWLPYGYVLSNNSFVGAGPSLKEKLNVAYSKTALEFLREEYEESGAEHTLETSVKDWLVLSRAYKVLEVWDRQTKKTSGRSPWTVLRWITCSRIYAPAVVS